MRPITRREAIGFGMLGGAGVLVGGLGLSRTGLPWLASPAPATEDVGGSAGGESLVEPEVLRSQDGVLRVELVAAQTVTSIAGRQARVLTYNGTVPGPSWWVRGGQH